MAARQVKQYTKTYKAAGKRAILLFDRSDKSVEAELPDPSALKQGTLTLLISHERSGSNYLRSYLRALGEHIAVGEVCSPGVIDPKTDPMSFLGFRHKRWVETPDFMLQPSKAAATSLLDDYFAHVLKQAGGKSVSLDIKYPHVHNFNPTHYPLFREPFLLEHARRKTIRIIHLSRRNCLEAVVSDKLANARGIWHATPTKKAADRSDAIKVNTKALLAQLISLEQQKNAVAQWTLVGRNLQIAYEDLTSSTAGSACLGRVAAFVGEKAVENFASPFQKVSPPLREIVSNWQEVCDICRANKREHYLPPLAS